MAPPTAESGWNIRIELGFVVVRSWFFVAHTHQTCDERSFSHNQNERPKTTTTFSEAPSSFLW